MGWFAMAVDKNVKLGYSRNAKGAASRSAPLRQLRDNRYFGERRLSLFIVILANQGNDSCKEKGDVAKYSLTFPSGAVRRAANLIEYSCRWQLYQIKFAARRIAPMGKARAVLLWSMLFCNTPFYSPFFSASAFSASALAYTRWASFSRSWGRKWRMVRAATAVTQPTAARTWLTRKEPQ